MGMELSAIVNQNPELQLKVLAGASGLSRVLNNPDINRPGLALAGYFKSFAADRLQIFGRGEHAFLLDRSEEVRENLLQLFFAFPIPGLVFTHGNEPPEEFAREAEEHGVALLNTPLRTTDFIPRYERIIQEALAPRTTVHGVLIDVFGVGILIMGPSGIGKSETALELVERGHRLIADDAVSVSLDSNELVGSSNAIIQHHMELRGIGIINVKDLFGIGAIRPRAPLELVIHLEDWVPGKEYERLGLDEPTDEFLGIRVPRILLPVRPGRNVPILVETAAMNCRSKKMGYYAARDLSARLTAEIQDRAILARNDEKP